MTDKSEDRGLTQSQKQNTSESMSSTPPTRILPKVDPAKTINLIQEGRDPNRVKK